MQDLAVDETAHQGGEQVDVVIAHGRRKVPDAVRALILEKIGRLERLCPGLDRAEVHFSEEHNPRISDRERCEVTVHGHGRTVRARAAGRGTLVAVDLVIEKLEHQLEKSKGRLMLRTQPRHRTAGPPPALYERIRTA